MPELDELIQEARKRGLFDEKPAEKTGSSEALKTVSSINTRIADTVGLPVDLVNKGLNYAGIGSAEPAGGSQSIKHGMKALGISEGEEPETTAGKMTAGLVGGGVEAALTGGGAGSAIKMAGERFAMPALKAAGASFAELEPNVVAGAGGGFGGEGGKEAFKGTKLEKPAEIVGELAGGGLAGLAKGGAHGAALATDPVVSAYERLKLAPSAGEALKKEGFAGRTAQWLQGNMLPQTIGGSNVMEAFKTRRMKELNDIREDIANSYGATKSREAAGQSVQERVMDTWKQRKDADGELIGDLTSKYGNDTLYPSDMVNALANPVGAPLTKAIRDKTVDPLVGELSEMLRNMKSGGQMTFKDLAGLKQYVGDKLEPGVVKNVNDAQVGQLFNAIRSDMESHIKTRSPDDFAKLQKSRERYADAQTEFKQYFKKLLGSKNIRVSAERVYEIVTGAAGEKGRGDLAEFRNVWDALPPDERGDLTSTMLIRMGATDTSNPQNVESWSLGKFLTGYKSLAPDAKDLMFDQNKPVRRKLEDLITVADNIQTKLTNLQSTSRSGTAGVQMGQIFTAIIGGSQHSPAGMAMLLGSIGGPWAAAKLLTTPKAVESTTEILNRLHAAMDASMRAGLELATIPKMHPQQQRGKLPQ